MRPLRYSINVTLDGRCDHREMIAAEDLHRHAMEPYLHVVAKKAGRALHILGRFHIAQHMSAAIDRVRRDEVRTRQRKGDGCSLQRRGGCS